MQEHRIEPGDIIEDVHRLFSHYGIVSDRLDGAGNFMIIAHSRRTGTVVEESWQDAFAGYKLKLIKAPGKLSRQQVLVRARSQIGLAKYNLVNNNCEHFVRWCHDLPKRSRQINGTAIGSALGFGAGILLTRNWRVASSLASAGGWLGAKLARKSDWQQSE